MDDPPRLTTGSQIRWPHCHRLHPLIQPYADEGTDYARAMLFVECRGGKYYVGQAAACGHNEGDGGEEKR